MAYVPRWGTHYEPDISTRTASLRLRFLPYHEHSVPNCDEHGGDARIARYCSIQFLNGRRLFIRRRVFHYITIPQDVVDQDGALRREEIQRPPVIVDVIPFVG